MGKDDDALVRVYVVVVAADLQFASLSLIPM